MNLVSGPISRVRNYCTLQPAQAPLRPYSPLTLRVFARKKQPRKRLLSLT